MYIQISKCSNLFHTSCSVQPNWWEGLTIFVSKRSTEVRDWAVKSNSMLLMGYHQQKARPGAAQKQTKDHPCLSQSLILDSRCHTSHLDREHASSSPYRSDSTMAKRPRSRPAVSIQWLQITCGHLNLEECKIHWFSACWPRSSSECQVQLLGHISSIHFMHFAQGPKVFLN